MDYFRRHEASEHYERAIFLEQAGRIDEALVEYRRAVDADPGFADAHQALGHHYRRRGLLTKALDAFHTVARLEKSYEVYFNVGYILLDLDRYEEALEAFQHCLISRPEDPTILYQIGYTHYVLGQLHKALTALRIPLKDYAQDGQVHSLVGDCYLGLGDWTAAEASYRRALEETLSPANAQDVASALQSALRYQELGDWPPEFKERTYANSGIVLLGTGGDDGLQIPLWQQGSFSAETVATTLHRLQAIVDGLELDLDAVVSIDCVSIPLAAALGQILSLPRKQLSQLDQQDRALLVLALGRQPELLQVALEQVPGAALTFVLALAWHDRADPLPDLVGVLVRGEVSLPWDESLRAKIEIDAATRLLLDAYERVPAEANLPAQVCYYTEIHRRLRFLKG